MSMLSCDILTVDLCACFIFPRLICIFKGREHKLANTVYFQLCIMDYSLTPHHMTLV